MPVELKTNKSSSSKATKRKSTTDNSKGTSAAKGSLNSNDDTGETLPEAIRYLGGKHRTNHQRTKLHQRFEELATVIGAADASLRALGAAESSGTSAAAKWGPSAATAAVLSSSSSSSAVAFVHAFPTLSVGYLARAMGLNVSKEQVTAIVELVEEVGPSTGFVDKRKLEPVLVDALLTGTIGGPTLREFVVAEAASADEAGAVRLSLERLQRFTPSLCVRDDEATLFRAFEALDVERKGYLEADDLRTPMTTEGEVFSTEEMDEMWMAMRDPETNRVYYRDFADVLARE